MITREYLNKIYSGQIDLWSHDATMSNAENPDRKYKGRLQLKYHNENFEGTFFPEDKYIEGFLNFPKTKNGFLANSTYYLFDFCDFQGYSWKTEKIIPSTEFIAGNEKRLLIKFCCTKIFGSKKELHSANNYFHGFIPAELIFPVNIKSADIYDGYSSVNNNELEYCMDNISIRIQKLQNGTCLVVKEASPCTDIIEKNYLSVMEFLFGRDLFFGYYYLKINGEISAGINISKEVEIPKISAPINFTAPDYIKDYGRLFIKYYSYLKCSSTGICNLPAILKIIRNSNQLLEIYLVTIGVCVETILRLFPDAENHTPQKDIECLENYLKSDTELEEATRKRIAGFINGPLKNKAESIKIKLNRLLNYPGLANDFEKAWDKCRNKFNHDVGSLKAPELGYRNAEENLLIVYLLIFQLIGYKGCFTDCSDFNYPVKNLNEIESKLIE